MIAAIENAILARLRAASDADVLGYHYRTLETYPDDWDVYLKDDGKVINAPAAWVTFAGWRRIDGEDDWPKIRLMFGLVVMAENRRNETATRHGGPVPAEPGSYQLAWDACSLLTGQSLGLDIDGLKVGSLHVVARLAALKERKVSMLAQELTTDIFVDGMPDWGADDIGEFRTFHANWDIPPFGGIDADPDAAGIQIPDDAHADATDHIELEQP